MPVLEVFLAFDGAGHGGMGFVPDETVDAVFPGEAGADVFLMAPHAIPEVGGDADVESSVAFAGEDVDAGGLGGGWGHGEC